jgi:hypothetical protein
MGTDVGMHAIRLLSQVEASQIVNDRRYIGSIEEMLASLSDASVFGDSRGPGDQIREILIQSGLLLRFAAIPSADRRFGQDVEHEGVLVKRTFGLSPIRSSSRSSMVSV